MSAQRFGRLQKATALVPLAVLSTAWTASLAGVGATTALASDTTPTTLPDGTSVPTEAIEAPASLSLPNAIAAGVPKGQGGAAVRNASTSGIPSVALAAYQRAETVINSADKSCNLPWQLVAAIGRVESDHGRYGGNVLDEDGVATPGIYGIALDGTNGTQRITDTDAGQYDNDTEFDRAVGPMQFIPSTWSVVGVDGDNDGKRNPQDIADAALAAAVYLCSGNEDLSSAAGQQKAVFRYNHSNSYVDLVLSIMESYMKGEFSAVPNGTTSAGVFTPDPSFTVATRAPKPQPKPGPSGSNAGNGGGTENAQEQPPTQEQPAEPKPDPQPAPSPPAETKDPVQQVEEKVKNTVKNPGGAVKDTLTEAEATESCLASGISELEPVKLGKCVADLLG
jgi:membrane-bound lytic murein transglycosylase B